LSSCPAAEWGVSVKRIQPSLILGKYNNEFHWKFIIIFTGFYEAFAAKAAMLG
jgi:hypothetical protein